MRVRIPVCCSGIRQNSPSAEDYGNSGEFHYGQMIPVLSYAGSSPRIVPVLLENRSASMPSRCSMLT